MKLVYWMYNGPAHLGTLRTASSFQNVHAIMHAPLGDDYFNVMRSMLERERDFTPVTASIVDRHVLARGSQEKVIENVLRKDKEEQPDLILLTPTCTSSILQEDLQNFADQAALHSQADVLLADVNHYRVNEFQAADRTLEQVVRFYLEKEKKVDLQGNPNSSTSKNVVRSKKPSANILGIFTLGFHHQHDCREIKRLLYECGIEVNLVLPEGGSVQDLKKLPEAWFNIVPYREIGLMAAQYLEKEYKMPYVGITPMGILETGSFLREINKILNEVRSSDSYFQETENMSSFDFEEYIERQTKFVSQSAWFSRSIDCQNLTGKKAVVFGDATHAAAMTKILAREMGIRVSCAGTYCKNDADWFREQVSGYAESILITDDHSQVRDMISRIQPNCLFGTQMERHIGKRLGIPCGVISSPSHIQNFPLGYRPFVGYEGTNQIADLVYNTNQLGMEEHLLEIFGGHDTTSDTLSSQKIVNSQISESSLSPTMISNSAVLDSISAKVENVQTLNINIPNIQYTWSNDALKELSKIPGFVRNKVKQNVELYAEKTGVFSITPEIMYAAKESMK